MGKYERPNADESKEAQQQKNKNRLQLVIILILIVIIILLLLKSCGTGSFWGSGGGEDPTGTTSGKGGVNLEIDPNAKPTTGKDEPDGTGPAGGATQAPEQGIAIPGWGSLTMPPNTTEISVDFYNPEANEGLYYLTFELRLPDDSERGYEVLYTSGLVPPGQHITTMTISRGLEVGVYDAILHVQPYRMDANYTPTNNADVKLQLIVI